MHEQVCAAGYDVFVSGRDGCDASAKDFARVIHIHHADGRDPGGECQVIRAGAPANVIGYTDCEPLAPETIERVASISREGGRLLVHCAFGQCRGPTLAIIAMCARGAAPSQALHDITVAIWRRRRIMPHWCPEPLSQIFAWWEAAEIRGAVTVVRGA